MKKHYAIGLILCLAVVFALSGMVLAQTESKDAKEAPKTGVTAQEKKAEKAEKESNPLVVFETTKGKITIELYTKEAPISVENFLAYVNEGFYAGTVFHRVIPRFVIQGGGMDADMNRKKTHAPIKNEADNGLKNLRGTLSMARTNDPNSATSQFFISLVDNTALDKSATSAGYAVFGKVVRGLDIVDAIAAVKTTSSGQYKDVPAKPITVTKAYEKTEGEAAEKTEGKAAEKKAVDKKASSPNNKKATEQKASDN